MLPSTLCAEFSNDPFQIYSEESKKALLSDLEGICDSVRKSQPNAEKFYAGFYSKLVKNDIVLYNLLSILRALISVKVKNYQLEPFI